MTTDICDNNTNATTITGDGVKNTQMHTGRKVYHLLQKTGLSDHRNNPNWIQDLSYEDFLHELIRWNGILRGIKPNERHMDGKWVYIGDWISPIESLKDEILKETFDVIKRLSKNTDRADLMAYMLLFLHIFNDGNGRLARLVHSYIDTGTQITPELLSDILDHHQEGSSGHRISRGSKTANPLMYRHSLIPFTNLHFFTGQELQSSQKEVYLEVDEYDSYDLLSNKVRENWGTKMSGHEFIQITQLFIDSAKGSIFTKFIETYRNGELSKYIMYTSFGPKLSLTDEFLISLTTDDLRRVLEIWNQYKKILLTQLIGVYQEPEKYKTQDGLCIKDMFRIK